MRMKKYEITDIAHPDNPKLHRIRALTDVGTDVHKGDLGGFVETEDNLDQEGFAWIGKDAIACEDSYIGGDAILADSAVARDSAYVGNNAVIADHAERHGDGFGRGRRHVMRGREQHRRSRAEAGQQFAGVEVHYGVSCSSRSIPSAQARAIAAALASSRPWRPMALNPPK